MHIGIPRETRAHECRVALTPSAVRALAQQGHRVWVETGAGAAAGFPDSDYQSAGATIVFGRSEPFLRSQLIACIRRPDPMEYDLLQPQQVVFGFWGLPTARPEDVRALSEREITAVGVEAIEDERGRAPVLTSMSEIAGSLAIIVGAGLLLNEFGGKGIVFGGAPGVPPASVVILGAGTLGLSAARAALGLGAQVTLLDVSVEHLRRALNALPTGTTTMLSTGPNVEKALGFADIVIGAVAVHGQRAPILVKRESLAKMRPRSVIMDLSIDMGGCFETSRPTTFPDPTYVVDGILHFCVPNLPSVAARSSTLAFTNALLPFLQEVAEHGFDAAILTSPALRQGTYLYRGRCVRESLARAVGMPCEPLPVPGGAEA